MKVKELIAALQSVDGSLEVYILDKQGDYEAEIATVEHSGADLPLGDADNKIYIIMEDFPAA